MRRFCYQPFVALAVLMYVAGAITLSCAKAAIPLSPAGQLTLQANQAVVILGTLQHTAIELNKVQDCQPMPCHPLLSDANTGLIVDTVTTALQTIKASPLGYRAAALNAVGIIRMRLTEAGRAQINQWLAVAETTLSQLQ